MYKNKKILALITARKNSVRLKKKNFLTFFKKPLIYWTISSALKSKYLDSIYVSTDMVEILKFSKKFKKEVGRRKKYTAEDAVYLWKGNTKDWFGQVTTRQSEWLERNKNNLLFKNLYKTRLTQKGERNKTFLDLFDTKDPKKRIELQNKYPNTNPVKTQIL